MARFESSRRTQTLSPMAGVVMNRGEVTIGRCEHAPRGSRAERRQTIP
jgi:hypothetical protein